MESILEFRVWSNTHSSNMSGIKSVGCYLRTKRNLRYLEQEQEKVEEFNKLLEELPEGTPIVYLDESVIKQGLIREHGYAKRVEEVFGKMSGKITKKLNIIAAPCEGWSNTP